LKDSLEEEQSARKMRERVLQQQKNELEEEVLSLRRTILSLFLFINRFIFISF
jgi:hypothetical protein